MVIAVLLGSVRRDRKLRSRGHETVLVDAAALDLPMLDRMWKKLKDSVAPEEQSLRAKLAGLAELYARVDGFCIVSAEYNHSVPPGLTNLIDYFLEEYFWRLSAIVCYSAGPFGGVRAAMQLRAMLAEVGMPSVPSLLPIPSIGAALSKEGVPLKPEFARGAPKFFREFEWYMQALGAQRAKGLPY